MYKARHSETGQYVAIKAISIRKCRKDQIDSILQEIDMLKHLQNESIVKYVGHKKTKKKLFIILEFIKNGSLLDLVKRDGPLKDEGKVAMFIYQVLKGLEYVHSEGVVHRDIKCANILIGDNEKLKLADFGVAGELNDTDTNPAGTPYWMAPEVIDGKNSVVFEQAENRLYVQKAILLYLLNKL